MARFRQSKIMRAASPPFLYAIIAGQCLMPNPLPTASLLPPESHTFRSQHRQSGASFSVIACLSSLLRCHSQRVTRCLCPTLLASIVSSDLRHSLPLLRFGFRPMPCSPDFSSPPLPLGLLALCLLANWIAVSNRCCVVQCLKCFACELDLRV